MSHDSTSHGPLGIHLGLSPSYEYAIEVAKDLEISCCQIFTHNPRSWQFRSVNKDSVDRLKKGLAELGVKPIVSHCNYLINLGTTGEVREKSIKCLRQELAYAKIFGCSYFILHVGKHKEASVEEGIRNVARGLNSVKKEIKEYKVMILLETVAGQGTEIGRTFDELGRIIDLVDEDIRPLIGVCVDTCHIFAAGYDIRSKSKVENVVKEMDDAFGIDRVKFIHLNDSLKDVGERRDRHVHIGEGFIGTAGFKAFLNHPKIKPLPKVIETPDDGVTGDEENLATVRKLQA